MSFKEYADYDALGLAELIQRGEVSPHELLGEAIRRRDSVNPQINAVVHRMDELAFASLDTLPKGGPFYGVPFLLKDFCAAYKGVPLTNGSRAFKDYIPDYDCELVKRFKASGVVTFGKTNTPEFQRRFRRGGGSRHCADGQRRRWRRLAAHSRGLRRPGGLQNHTRTSAPRPGSWRPLVRPGAGRRGQSQRARQRRHAGCHSRR